MRLARLWGSTTDREQLRQEGLILFSKLIRTKNVENLQEKVGPPREDNRKIKLTKCLTTLDLTSLGVGSCVGTGMYLVAGMVAKKLAGPGVIFSFMIAAIASIFSGACYAEFGVRVPHTTGSAYMYSYVTVGEFLAFVIGWNMILEYLIGTSACACALSACFDALSNGAISASISSSIGSIFSSPPDFVAFFITLLMMLLLAAGVKKSLIFNNILNAINLAVWVFVMTAGLFYVNSENWSQHEGFLPFGWSGVFTGAATCFYAFIGFDIIATTGEEATNPKKSIPLAIVSSLVIILIAYVTSSMMLTLIVPYNQIDEESGLVEMFGQVGANKCKYIVAVGALAGLTVSMFGSMFPMPRIIYAMASDGLIFRIFSQVWPRTSTPALATLISGLSAALVALIIDLGILVEMMSIGTLLAYTLVSTCVLILRYQPHSTNLVELLPQSLRTPLKGTSPSDPKAPPTNGQQQVGANKLHQNAALHSNLVPSTSPLPQQTTQRILVRRVTRSSPDSDDTLPGDDQEEEFSLRDDQFLVSDRTENKFYGTVHGATGGNVGNATGMVGSTVGPSLGYLGRRLQAATYLCPAIFPWVDTGPATEESGMLVMKLVGIMYILIVIFDLIIVCGMHNMTGVTTFFFFVFFFGILAILLIISRKPQNRSSIMFMTPCLPFVPAIAITVNIYLIFKLSILTLVRFTIWMSLGLIMYFYYGIKNSSLEEDRGDQNNIELTVTSDNDTQKYHGHYNSACDQPQNMYREGQQAQYEWDPNQVWNPDQAWSEDQPPRQYHQVEQHFNVNTNNTKTVLRGGTAQNATRSAESSKSGNGSGMFVNDMPFPTWDD